MDNNKDSADDASVRAFVPVNVVNLTSMYAGGILYIKHRTTPLAKI